MNSNFSVTDIPGRRRLPLSQELGLHPKLTHLLLQFAEAGSLTDAQRWLLAGVLPPVSVDPVTEGAFLDVQLTRDPRDRLGAFGDHLDSFFAEFWREFLALFWHWAPSFWTEILLGSCPESSGPSKRRRGYRQHERT